MTKKYLLSTAIVFALAAMPVLADDAPTDKGFYAEINGGMSFNQTTDLDTQLKTILPGFYDLSFDNSALFTGAAGYDFGNVRADFEIGYTDMDLDEMTLASTRFAADGDMSVLTVMANGYWDIPTKTLLTPFVGAGIGLAHISVEAPTTADPTVDDDDTVFAYQATAGANYQVTDHLSLVGSYRYLGTTEGSFRVTSATLAAADDVKASFSAHQLRAGVRWVF